MPKKPSSTLWASASAISMCDPVDDGCLRKFYALKCLKLPEPPRKATTFGDVVHNVIERFQKADENGRNPDGTPFELYPEGWEYPVNKFTGEREDNPITREEQAVVKLLISKSIEEGVLVRLPGRKVEEKIERWKIMEGVLITGFIDLLQADAIEDHKTCKTMNYALSPRRGTKKYLGSNIQLMLYAYWYYTEGGYDKTQPLLLKHNYYCHGDMAKQRDPHVEPREAYTTWEEVEVFWTSRIKPVLEQMKEIKKAGGNDPAYFNRIPMPHDPEKSCRKYGTKENPNCPLIKVCNGIESINDYKRRMDGLTDQQQSEEYASIAGKLNPQGGTKMAESPIMRKIREAKEARERAEKGGAAEPPKQEEAPPVQAQQEEKPAETKTEPPKIEAPKAASESGAPWYQDGCKACSGGVVPGFNPSTKAPCNICKVRSKKNGGPVPDDYDFDIGEGEVVFVHKETGEEIVRQIVAEEATSKQSAPAEKPAAKEEPPAETVTGNAGQPSNTPAKPAPAPEPPLNQEPLGPKTESAALFADAQIVTEREKFELIIEASIVEAKSKGGGKLGSPSCVITGEELHAMVISHLSAVIGPAGGPAGWHGVDPWKRKDAIRMYGREIADMCGSSTVVFGRLPRASELEVIVEAIRPYARRVIQALAG